MVWKGFPAFPAHLRMRPVSRGNSRRATCSVFLGFSGGSAPKESACNEGDLGSIPRLEDPLKKGTCYPLQNTGLKNSMDCSMPGSSVHGNSPCKNSGAGCQALLQGIFPTQGSNPGLTHCRQILYQMSHQRSPRILKWVVYPFSRLSS